MACVMCALDPGFVFPAPLPLPPLGSAPNGQVCVRLTLRFAIASVFASGPRVGVNKRCTLRTVFGLKGDRSC